MVSRVREGLLLVIQGMFMKTFISAAQEKENGVSRVAQPGQLPWESTGNQREPCLRIPEAQMGQHSWQGLTLQHRDRIVASECRDCEFKSCFCSLHCGIYFSSCFLNFGLERNSVERLQNIHPQVTSKFVFGEPLRESDPGFRLSESQETCILVLALKLFHSLPCKARSMGQQHYLGTDQ